MCIRDSNPSVHYASRLLEQAGLIGRLMIDMSHANSGKDHNQQIRVCQDICKQVREGESRIFGVMIESNLVAGNQKIGAPESMTYGQSVTDACIGWEDTVTCLTALADASAARMESSAPATAGSG